MRLKSLLLSGFAAICLFATAFLFAGSRTPSSLTPPAAAIPAEFFGLHIHRAFSTTPWPPVPFGSWRLWDARVHWGQVEVARNEWHWEILDREVELAEKHHIDLILPFGETAEWAGPVEPVPNRFERQGRQRRPLVLDITDMEDWRTYVRATAQRYKGRIRYYEIWNEPNNPKNRGFGTPDKMLTLAREAYTILKQVDPDIQVISPSPVNPDGIEWLDHYLAIGGAQYADIIGYHFYVRTQPESMLELILPVKEVMQKHGISGKPLWNTESGWIRSPLTVPIDPVQQAPGWAARAYILNWAAGVQRFYWYAWDDDGGDSIPFTEEDQSTPTISAHAYAEVQKWLIGWRMESCDRQSDATWVCKLSRAPSRSAWILWNENHKVRFDVPKSWPVQTLTKISGDQSPWSGGAVDVSELPVLLGQRSADH